MEADSERVDGRGQHCCHSKQRRVHSGTFVSEQGVDGTERFCGLEQSCETKRCVTECLNCDLEEHCSAERCGQERSCDMDHCELEQRCDREQGDDIECCGPEHSCDTEGHSSDQSCNIKPCASNQRCDTDRRCGLAECLDTQHNLGREQTCDSQPHTEQHYDVEQCLETDIYNTKQHDNTIKYAGTEQSNDKQHGTVVFFQTSGDLVCGMTDNGESDLNAAKRDTGDGGFVNSDDHKHTVRGGNDIHIHTENSDCEGGLGEGVGGCNEECVGVWRDNSDDVIGNRSAEKGVKDQSNREVVCSRTCDLQESQSWNQDRKMDFKDDDAFLHVDDGTNHNHISQSSSELSDGVSENNNKRVESVTENHNEATIFDCDNSEVVDPTDHRASTACGICETVHNFSRGCEHQLTVPTLEFQNNNVHYCPDSESYDTMNNNVRVDKALTEHNNTQIPTQINTGNSDSDEHTNTDDQNDTLSSDSKVGSIVEHGDNLPNMEQTVDSSDMTQVESSLKNNISNPIRNTFHRNRWTKVFAFTFLRKTLQRRKEPEPPHVLGTISDQLPEVHREGILHTGGHDNSFAVPKKLAFQIPEHSKHTAGNGTVIIRASHPHPRSVKKLSRCFSFPTLSRVVHKKRQDAPPSPDSGHTTRVDNTNTSADLESGRPSSSQTHHHSENGRNNNDPALEEVGARTDRTSNYCLPLADKFRKWWRSDSSIEGKEIRNTLVVGVAFQLIFTAHFAIQNLQSSLHEEEYLGVSALGCLYAASIFSSIFAPTIIGLLGLKGCLVLAWLTHMLYTLAQFYPTWQTLVPVSVLLGALTGPTWTAQGVYVSACAFSFSRRSPHSPYTILSRFNGLFFTLYETRQILGNLLSSVVLRHGLTDNDTTASQEVIFKFCGPKDCPWAENVTDIEEPEGLVIHAMLAIYTALQVVALVLTVVFLTPLTREEWCSRAPIRETVTSWFKTLVGTRMVFLVPFMVFQAMEQGMLLSEYTKSYISCPIGIHMVGFVMATHGATSAVFVFVFSRLARRTGRYPLFALAAVISLVLLIVLYDWTPQAEQEALIFAFPVLWGIGEGIWHTQTNSMIAVMFWNRKESAFANYQTWRAVGFTFIFSFHSILCVDVKIAVTLGFLVVGMIFYTAVEVHSYRKERRSSSSSSSSSSSVSVSFSTSKKVRDEGGGGGDDESGGASNSSGAGRNSSAGGGGSNKTAEDLRCSSSSLTSSTTVRDAGLELKINPNPSLRNGGSSSSSTDTAVGIYPSFKFHDDDIDLGSGGHLTLDGTYLTRGESAFLDNDLQKYGVNPSSGCRPLTNAQLAKSCSFEEYDWWALREESEVWNSGEGFGFGSTSSQPATTARPHSWHEVTFQDQGELRVLRTKDDVFVY